MFKKVFALLLGFLLLTFLIACGTPWGSTGSANEVHMTNNAFTQSSIRIAKGSVLQLVNDAGVPHLIKNGMWNNGTSRTVNEPGAPGASLQFVGNDTKTLGPFPTTGTFHFYCVIHVNMNLTIIVQ